MDFLGLTPEELLQLRLLADRLQRLDRDELIEMVLELREGMLLQQKEFQWHMLGAGLDAQVIAPVALALPESEEELVAVFGRVPSDQEVAEYINGALLAREDAVTDVDIEAIVLGVD